MNRKIVVALLLFLVMILTMAACSTTQEEPAKTTSPGETDEPEVSASDVPERTFKIAFSLYDFSTEWASNAKRFAEEYAKNYPEIEMVWLDAANDMATMISQIENQVTAGIDAVICMPVDESQTRAMVDVCRENNVPIIGFNRQVEGGDSQIQCNEEKAGQLFAEAMVATTDYKANIAILRGTLGVASDTNRHIGVVSVLEKHPDCNVVFEASANWNRDQAVSIVENWLASGQDLDLIIAYNDGMAMGAVLAVESANMQDSILVSGSNGDVDALNAVKEGRLYATCSSNPKGQAEKAIDVARDLCNGKTVEKFYTIEYVLVDKNNVDEFLNLN